MKVFVVVANRQWEFTSLFMGVFRTYEEAVEYVGQDEEMVILEEVI